VGLRRLARIIRHRVTSVMRPSRLDREVERELQVHLEALAREKIDEGLSPEAARREARLSLGNPAALREACRDQRRVGWIHDAGQDVRYGWRMLAGAPAFSIVAIVSLGLGIGATAGVLGLIGAIQYDSMPAGTAGRLVAVRGISLDRAATTRGVSAADYAAWKERSTSFDALELSLSGPRDLGGEGSMHSERTNGLAVTAGYLPMLGVEPLAGRFFTADEARARAPVVILSEALWRRRYGGRHDIIDQSIPIGEGRSTVIGVVPRTFRYRSERIELWTPLHIPPTTPPSGGRLFSMIGRLAPGVPLERAQSDLRAISARLADERPEVNAGWTVDVHPLQDEFFGWTREPLLLLLGAVAVVFLMACANLAALLLARGTIRHREIAVRAALGAGRARLVRQLLVESLLLAATGGALGLAVAWITIRGLVGMPPPVGTPPIAPFGLDLRVLAVITALSAASAFVFGVVPALVVSAATPGASLNGPGSPTVSRRGHGLRGALVAGQIALALLLSIVFGLLVSSFLRLERRHLNMETSDLLMFEVRTHAPLRVVGQHRGFPYVERLNAPAQTFARILERLRLFPGVEAAGGISYPPVDSLILPTMEVRLERSPHGQAAYFLVTPGLFETLRTPLTRGRDLAETDTAERSWVAIVNEAAAARFWPGSDPIGQLLTIDSVPEERPREVIGVVRNIPTRHAQLEPQPIVYASYLQQPARYRGPYASMFGQMTFHVRAANPLDLVAAIREAVAEIETRPVASVMTVESRRSIGRGRTRYDLGVLGILTAAAALLVAIGVYGLLTYTVSLTTREIGIRKALGAARRSVALLLARHVLAVVFFGLVAGWAGAIAATRLLASRLWGVSPTDPATFLIMGSLLVAVALLACIGPVRRAMSVDPTVALRCE
jgi:putative ABC transport system permease protein